MQREALVAPSEVALEWPIVRVQTFDVIFQRVHASEKLIAHRAIDLRPVRVVNLQVPLKSILTVKRFAARWTNVFPGEDSITHLTFGLHLAQAHAVVAVVQSLVGKGRDCVAVARGHAQ